MKKIQEIRDWLLKNAVDDEGNLDLSNLDFSDFDGNVFINYMRVKRSLYQNCQEVGDSLLQRNQIVAKNLYQDSQNVGGELLQNNQKVKENLYQSNQTVGKNFYNHRLKDNEYWEEEGSYTIRKNHKKITRKQLAEMGYKLEDDNYEI